MKFRISGFLGFRGFSGSEVWEFSFWGYLWTVGLWRKVGLRAWETAATVETDYERPERRGKPLHPDLRHVRLHFSRSFRQGFEHCVWVAL